MNEFMDDIGQGTVILAFGIFMVLTAPVWIPAWIVGRAIRAIAPPTNQGQGDVG